VNEPVFSRVKFDLVNNVEYTFYKLMIDGECPMDNFLQEVEADPDCSTNFNRIIAMMDVFSKHNMLPYTKFRQIKGVNRSDLFEFKCKNLRVYVVLCAPDVFVVCGGFKRDQEKDIARLKRKLRDFDVSKL
jgi:hypothetical protein